MSAGLFVPLDVNTPDDPKILAAGDRGELVYYRSLCLAKRCMSDGFIATEQLRLLGATAKDAGALERTGLWVAVDGGWTIPGFLKRNKSAAEIREHRDKEAERKRTWRKQRDDIATRDGTAASDGTDSRATASEVKSLGSESESPKPPDERYEAAIESLVRKRMDKPGIKDRDAYAVTVNRDVRAAFEPRLRSLMERYPEAPSDVLAAHVDGESSSLRYYRKVEAG